jgi:hypothetical protein
MDRTTAELDSSGWPGFRALLSAAALERFAQPPNSDARQQFASMQGLTDADGQEIGVLIVTGQPQVDTQVVCVVRWNPALADEVQARAAFARLLAS